MANSSKSALPAKPYDAYPLTPHASGKWQKKVRGKIHYFGRWATRVNGKLVRIEGEAGWKPALTEYERVSNDLHAGRTPRPASDEVTVENLCDHYLTSKKRKLQAGEITVRTFAEYKAACDVIVGHFGRERLVNDLAAEDFATLRASLAKRWGPVRLAAETVRIKSVFKFGVDNSLVSSPIRYGTEFKPPSRSVLRRHRAKSGP